MRIHRICGECRNSKPYNEGEYPLLCKKDGLEVCGGDSCENFVPKEILIDKLQAAAKKCATTGNHRDLQKYLKLRREML